MVSRISEKSLDMQIDKMIKKYNRKPWYTRRKKSLFSVKHIPTGEIVQVTVEGKGSLCEHIRNKIIYGWTFKQLTQDCEDLGEV